MGNSIEKTGKTVQEAIDEALAELNVDESSVNVEIIDEGKKGLFGRSGTAKVVVTLKEDKEESVEKAINFIADVLEKMNISAEYEVEEDDESILIRISGEDIGIVIGRRGETLDSLQYLTSLVVNKDRDLYKRITIDIENYRQKREETLVRLANRLADRVVKYKKDVTLEPMNPYERRIIHSTLQEYGSVDTYSVGEDPNRKVVITLKR
jgi:spoIIIJ-associated protein